MFSKFIINILSTVLIHPSWNILYINIYILDSLAFEIFDISIKTNVCTDDSNLLLKQHIMNIQQIPSIMLVTFQGINYWALWHYVSSWKEHAIVERDEASERDRPGSLMVP